MKVNALAAHQKGSELQPHDYKIEHLEANECLIRVIACGICYSDIHMIEDDWGLSRFPLVPGHEVIGEVVEIGSQVTHLKIGERVGIGWQSSACMHCADCLRGDENLCDFNKGLIVHGNGGFADYLKVDGRFAFKIPDGIDTEAAAPLLCAGVTVYSALRQAGMTSGQNIGVLGVGGLGHLAVQFASRMGNRVTVFTTSEDKANFAHHLGSHDAFVVSQSTPPPPPKRRLDILLSTVHHPLDLSSYLDHLDSNGTLVVVGLPAEPLSIPVFPLLLKRRRVMASIIGGRGAMSDMLRIADQFCIQPTIEVFPFNQANVALAKVKKNQVRYRAVLSNSSIYNVPAMTNYRSQYQSFRDE